MYLPAMLFSSRSRRLHLGLLLLRVGLGLSLMFHHGAEKLFGGPAAWQEIGAVLQMVGIERGFAGFGLAASLAEFVGGALLVLGLAFRPALVGLLATMGVATMAHLSGTLPGSGAYALNLFVVFASLLLLGPGRHSFDAHLRACADASDQPASADPALTRAHAPVVSPEWHDLEPV